MNISKINSVLNDLELEIKKINNPEERELSQIAFINPFFNHKNRYKSDLQIISSYFRNGVILEIGSSPYHLTFCLRKLGYKVIGVDVNPKVLAKFQNKHKLKIVKCNIEYEKLPFNDNQFDLVIFNEVFEHLGTNPLAALKELRRVLKTNGILILTTPNLYAFHKVVMFNLGKSFNNAYEELKKTETFGYMGHIREYSNKEIREILAKSGFTVKATLFRKYNNFSDHPFFKFLPLNILAFLLDVTIKMLPSLRPFQVVISIKDNI